VGHGLPPNRGVRPTGGCSMSIRSLTDFIELSPGRCGGGLGTATVTGRGTLEVDASVRGGDFHWPTARTFRGHQRGPHLATSGDFFMATDNRALGEYAKAIPYGIYDVANNEGWVSVGDSADTAEFAVESIRRWWNLMGRARFGDADRLLITADAGGSNGYRLRAWKVELARLAAETGLRITV